jgi:hypothetical protein
VALTETRVPETVVAGAPRGFRPSSRRRARVAVGAGLAAVAIGGNVLVYSSLDEREPVLQVIRDVPAGMQITADDLRPVEVAVDSTVGTIAADDAASVVGQYARVRLVSGSLIVVEALQREPLVAPGSAVVAVQVPDGALPAGLRERSQVELVAPPDGTRPVPFVVVGRVVGLPTATESVTGTVSLSVELPVDAAAAVAASDDVRIVLLEPGVDAASTATDDGS